MRKLLAPLMVLMLTLSLGVAVFGQAVVHTNATATATVERTNVQSSTSMASFGFKNIVHIKAVRSDGVVIADKYIHNQVQDAGFDLIAQAISNTAAQPASCNYVGVANTDQSAAATSLTSLTTELGVGSGNNAVGRGQGSREVFSHTTGTKTYTVVKSWTASGGSVTVRSTGLFNAASGGTMCYIADFGTVTINSGDTLTVTWTVTMV